MRCGAPGADLPEGWLLDASSQVLSRSDGTDAFRLESSRTSRSRPPAAGSFWDDMQSFALTWLPIIFMGLIAVAVVWMVQLHAAHQAAGDQALLVAARSRWDDVAGVEEAKDELREVVEFLRDPKRFRKLGAQRAARASCCTARPAPARRCSPRRSRNESNANFFAQSAVLVRRDVRRPRRRAHPPAVPPGPQGTRPAIIFIDELDAVGATRGKDISGEKDQTLNQLLVEMDGFAGRGQRRRDRRLEPAREARPGAAAARAASTARSSSRRPTSRAAGTILEVHTRDKPLAADVDLDIVARQTSGLTGADLANICNEAAIFAGREHRDELIDHATSRPRSSGSSPACSRAA